MGQRRNKGIDSGVERIEEVVIGGGGTEADGEYTKTRGETERADTEGKNDNRKDTEFSLTDEYINTYTIPKKRGRPPGSKTTKKVETKATNQDLNKNISMILEVGFNFASLKLGTHWATSTAEVETISRPLSQIIEQSAISDKVSQFSPYIALLLAVSVIVVPRILLTQQLTKGDTIHEQKREVDKPSQVVNIADGKRNIENGKHVGNGIKSALIEIHG